LPRSRCARRRYWVDDGEFDPTLYGEKVRELIGEYLEPLSVEQVFPRLPDRKRFPREGRGAGQPPARASEMEHAIRHHITVHLAEDPAPWPRTRRRIGGSASGSRRSPPSTQATGSSRYCEPSPSPAGSPPESPACLRRILTDLSRTCPRPAEGTGSNTPAASAS
jgi:hypothetical protein